MCIEKYYSGHLKHFACYHHTEHLQPPHAATTHTNPTTHSDKNNILYGITIKENNLSKLSLHFTHINGKLF